MIAVNNILSDSDRSIEVNDYNDYVALSRKGLTVNQLFKILEFTGISKEDISKIISVSIKQLDKYQKDKILNKNISAQLIQITDLYKKGYELYENESNFRSWMNAEIIGLGGVQPKSLLDTTFGIQSVFNELGRLEHGVYS